MTDLISGLVVAVSQVPVGTQTAAAAAINDVVLLLDDTIDMVPTGGQVTIDGVVTDYASADDDASTITLAAPLAAALAEGAEVLVHPLRVEMTALTLIDGHSDPIPATVPHNLQDALPVGIREEEARETVRLTRDGQFSWAVYDIPGLPLLRDANYLDPATLPDGVFNHLTAESLSARDILAEAINATDMTAVTMTGATVQSEAAAERGLKLGRVGETVGLFAYTASGALFLKAVPDEGMAVVAGEVKARSLTVSSDDPAVPARTSLGGLTEIATGGTVRLTAGTTAPASAPTVTTGYDSLQFTADGRWDDRGGWATDGTDWYTCNLGDDRLERWSAAGARTTAAPAFDGATRASVTHTGTRIYTLTLEFGDWFLNVHNSTTLEMQDSVFWTHADGTRWPALGYDASTGELLIAQSRPSNADKVRIRRYTPTFNASGGLSSLTAGSFVDTDLGYAQDLAGVFYGAADFGADRYVITNRGGFVFRSIDAATGAFLPGEYWPSGMTAKVGFTYSGGAFRSMDQAGLMRTYTGITTTVDNDPNMTKWVSNTLASGATPTYETDQSPRAKITMPKRSKLIVTTSPIVNSGANPPDRVRIYVGQGSSDPGRTGMAKQADPAAGVTTVSYTSLVAPPGTNPPAANNFPGGAGSQIEGTVAGAVQAFITHDGTLPASAFRDSVRADTGRALAAYAVTLTNWTLGDGTLVGRFRQNGKHVDVEVVFTFGSTSVASGHFQVSLPATPRTVQGGWPLRGNVHAFDTSAAAFRYYVPTLTGAGNMAARDAAGALAVTGTAPWTWAAGDQVVFLASYEAA
jgi:hypothetical protein